MQYVYLVLGWTFGSLFLLIGLVALVENPFPGPLSLGIAALLIPPFTYALFRRVSRAIPIPHLVVAVLVLFVSFGLFADSGWGASVQEVIVWLLAIGIAAAAIIVGATRSKQQKAIEQHAISSSSTPSTSSPAALDSDAPHAHDAPSNSSTTLELQLSSSVSLELAGDSGGPEAVRNFIFSSCHSTDPLPERVNELAALLAQFRMACPAVESWRKAIVLQVRKAATAAVAKEHDIAALKGGDPDLLAELMESATADALESLDERPSCWRRWDELAIEEPESLETVHKTLKQLNFEPNLAESLLRVGRNIDRPVVLQPSQGIQEWVRLCELGRAIRGAELPPDALVNAYELAELNEAIEPERTIRKKADAVAALTDDAINRLPHLSRVFLISNVDGDFMQGLDDFGWLQMHARLILNTVMTAERVKDSVEKGTANGSTDWYIRGDCCGASRNWDGRKLARKPPSQLPPFHIGCEARLIAL